MTVGPTPLCYSCAHYNGAKGGKFLCDAFPRGIPFEIISWQADHRKPFEGDGGIRYALKDGAELPTAVLDRTGHAG